MSPEQELKKKKQTHFSNCVPIANKIPPNHK